MSKILCMTLSLSFLVFACSKSDFKTVKQQQAGEYSVTVLTPSGTIKNGTNDFMLEFRKTGDNQLVDVGTVEISPIMEMAGMAPMMAPTTVMPADTPGRYRATTALTMAGLWKFNVKFGSGQSVRINLNAE
jgi:hypothetical protein